MSVATGRNKITKATVLISYPEGGLFILPPSVRLTVIQPLISDAEFTSLYSMPAYVPDSPAGS